jgi:hypothetical protein
VTEGAIVIMTENNNTLMGILPSLDSEEVDGVNEGATTYSGSSSEFTAARRARRWSTALAWIWQMRLSDTPST